MTIKKRILFWRLNPIKTEKYLCDMAKEGYLLQEVSNSNFIFTKNNCTNLEFKISYKDTLSSRFTNDGWTIINVDKKWNIIFRTSKEKASINISRENILKYLKTIKYVMGIPYCIYLTLSLLPLTLFFSILIFTSSGSTVTYMPFWWIGPILLISFNVFYIYII